MENIHTIVYHLIQWESDNGWVSYFRIPDWDPAIREFQSRRQNWHDGGEKRHWRIVEVTERVIATTKTLPGRPEDEGVEALNNAKVYHSKEGGQGMGGG